MAGPDYPGEFPGRAEERHALREHPLRERAGIATVGFQYREILRSPALADNLTYLCCQGVCLGLDNFLYGGETVLRMVLERAHHRQWMEAGGKIALTVTAPAEQVVETAKLEGLA